MIFDLTELLTSRNAKSLSAQLPLEKVKIQGVEYDLKTPISFQFIFTPIEEKEVALEGTFETTFIIPCNRCLEEVEYPMEVTLSKFFVLDQLVILDEDQQADMKYVQENTLQVGQMIIDEIMVHFPMKVLCNENCKGICKSCGCNLNDNKCDCDSLDIDPRMAVFQDIKNNFKEV